MNFVWKVNEVEYFRDHQIFGFFMVNLNESIIVREGVGEYG